MTDSINYKPRREQFEDRLAALAEKAVEYADDLDSAEDRHEALASEFDDAYKASASKRAHLSSIDEQCETFSIGVYSIWTKDGPVYVGESTALKDRLRAHLNATLGANPHPMYVHLRSLSMDDFYFKVLEEVEDAEPEFDAPLRMKGRLVNQLLTRESHWIRHYKALGHRLFNKTGYVVPRMIGDSSTFESDFKIPERWQETSFRDLPAHIAIPYLFGRK